MHVGDEVHIQTSLSPSKMLKNEAEYYRLLGIKFLTHRLYEQALKCIKIAFERGEESADLHYYFALAMTARRRPKLSALSTVRTIENHLRMATELEPRCKHAYLLWAIVKYDYYVLNCLTDRPPTVQQLLERVGSVNPKYVEEILYHTYMPGNRIWESLKATWKPYNT